MVWRWKSLNRFDFRLPIGVGKIVLHFTGAGVTRLHLKALSVVQLPLFGVIANTRQATALIFGWRECICLLFQKR